MARTEDLKQIVGYFKSIAEEHLEKSRKKAYDGTTVFMCDLSGHYGEFWHRDFAMTAECVPHLVKAEELIGAIDYIISGARAEDGWIPDRVSLEGDPCYSAGPRGKPCGLPNLDTVQHLIFMVDQALRKLPKESAVKCFCRWYAFLCRGLSAYEKDERGLIYNDPFAVHSPWGFNDTICKTGSLLMESLLYWKACCIMLRYAKMFGLPHTDFEKEKNLIEANLEGVFLRSDGMLSAATNDGCQTDVFGSLYALHIAFPLSADVREGIAKWVVKHYDDIVQHGQVRNLPKDEYWHKTLIPVPQGTYMNGAYWAFVTPWLVEAILPYDRELAEKTLLDLYHYYNEYGIYECVNSDYTDERSPICKDGQSYRKLQGYVISATTLYPIVCKVFG